MIQSGAMAAIVGGVSVVQAGQALGVSVSTVWRMIRRGDLPSVRHRGRRLVPERALSSRIARPRRAQIPPFSKNHPIFRSPGQHDLRDETLSLSRVASADDADHGARPRARIDPGRAGHHRPRSRRLALCRHSRPELPVSAKPALTSRRPRRACSLRRACGARGPRRRARTRRARRGSRSRRCPPPETRARPCAPGASG